MRKKRPKNGVLWEDTSWRRDPNSRLHKWKLGDEVFGYVLEWSNPMHEAYVQMGRVQPGEVHEDPILGPTHPIVMNGYVKYPERVLQEESYNGLLSWAPVHGGITYAEQHLDGFVYGFDTMHADDNRNPKLRDLDHLKALVEQMAVCIDIAGGYEEAYLKAPSEEARAKVIEMYREELAKDFDVPDTLGYGAMIKMLGGKL